VKKDIHPKYIKAIVTCGCGESFETRSTKAKIMVEVCGKCHPFYTGKQKFVDSAGRIEKFQRKYNWKGAETLGKKADKAEQKSDSSDKK